MAAKFDAEFEHGLDVVDQIYGPGVREQMVPLADDPLVDETVRRLFGAVWTRPGLSVRDRRLLVLGVTATLSRPDLIETQVLGALRNGEFDEAALKEVILILSFYAGWPNGTAVNRGIGAALKTFRAEQAAKA
jgi:alkylhydroperoxidase/carboxymuconolactone decarboxylase family protein YurZ